MAASTVAETTTQLTALRVKVKLKEVASLEMLRLRARGMARMAARVGIVLVGCAYVGVVA